VPFFGDITSKFVPSELTEYYFTKEKKEEFIWGRRESMMESRN
jgi:hypothetical protein